MAQYRIVKKKHSKESYKLQKRIYGIFWYTLMGDILEYSLRECERYLETLKERDKIKRDNPRDIVVKTY